MPIGAVVENPILLHITRDAICRLNLGAALATRAAVPRRMAEKEGEGRRISVIMTWRRSTTPSSSRPSTTTTMYVRN